MSIDTSIEKKKLTAKMKLYRTSKFESNNTSFEKKSHYKNETTSDFISNDISFALL